MIMKTGKKSQKMKNCWDKLDSYWAETYEADYGYLFNISYNNKDTMLPSLPVSYENRPRAVTKIPVTLN